MIQLTPDNIMLGAGARNKEEAIRIAGRLLVENGNIAPGYVESMLGRETQANTYLGNGIAIPHGLGQDRELILQTGISVVQFPAGVEWNPDQIVYLAVGIAAKSDEHIGVLSALTDVLDDAAMAEKLARTNAPADIIAALTRQNDAPPAAQSGFIDGQHVDVRIIGDAGLHARPATYLVDVATQFSSEIRIQHGAKIANAKAMASLLKLGVEGGETIRIIASGADATAALEALKEAIESGLGETKEKEAPPRAFSAWQPVSAGRSIIGVSASPGIAIGRLFQFQAARIVVTDHAATDSQAEKLKFEQALETAREQLSELYEAVVVRSGKTEAGIFRAHQALLADEDLYGEVQTLLESGHTAAWSWQQAIDERIAELQKVTNERLAARAADFRDVGQRVLRLLVGTQHSLARIPNEPVVLIADDLTPSDTAKLDPKRILGLCTASGGPTSHTAIIARSLDIPAVVGAGSQVLEQTDGITCILDGSAGRIYVEPSVGDLESARSFQIDLHLERDKEYQSRYEPAILTDGHRVEVVANIGSAADALAAVEAGAEGVGLMRTEFLFLNRDTPPTEEEQFETYSAMTRSLNGLPLIIRTLDIGGDKVVPYLALPKEENPFLGIRGVRLCLRKPELFIPQLRAIYRASTTGPILIMFPMIATVEDLTAAKQIAERVRLELEVPPVEIGIMIEVPSAVIIAEELAREADFFSIGTNDLTQYVLAMDRMHPVLGSQVDALHPAVLRMIDLTVRAATKAGRWVGVCGGIAGDPVGALILTGLGVKELSMSIPSIAAVKSSMRGYSLTQAKDFARRALACSAADEVRRLPLP